MRRLHDRPAGGTRPPHRLHPGRERTLAGGEPGSPVREIRVEDRDEVQAGDAEVAHGVRPADEHLAGGPRQSGLRNAPNRDARRSRRPGLDPFGAAAPHAERGPAAGGASARCFHRPHTGSLLPRRGACHRTRRTPPRRHISGRPARCRAPGSGEKRKARRASARARTSRGARPSGPGRTISTFGQRCVVGATVGSPSDAASVDGQAAARTATAPPIAALRSATSRTWYTAHALHGVRGATRAPPRSSRGTARGRIPPVGFRPRRRPRRTRSAATCDSGCARHRPRTPRGAPRTRARAPSPSPAGATPRARSRSPDGLRQGRPAPPRRRAPVRPRGPDARRRLRRRPRRSRLRAGCHPCSPATTAPGRSRQRRWPWLDRRRPLRLFRGHTRRRERAQHLRQRRDVAHRASNGRVRADRHRRTAPARPRASPGACAPAGHRSRRGPSPSSAVRGTGTERGADAGLEVGGQDVGERPVEREERAGRCRPRPARRGPAG